MQCTDMQPGEDDEWQKHDQRNAEHKRYLGFCPTHTAATGATHLCAQHSFKNVEGKLKSD